eukprot:m.338518 g.338518  ORF g.338518 m.338518 type:complete len:199 (+) comp18451_c0_seq1:238-834(+)
MISTYNNHIGGNNMAGDLGSYQLSQQGFRELADELDAKTLRDMLLEINTTVPDSSNVIISFLKENKPEALQQEVLCPASKKGSTISRSFSLGMLDEANKEAMPAIVPDSITLNNPTPSKSKKKRSTLQIDTAGHCFSLKAKSGTCIICGKPVKGFFSKSALECETCQAVVHVKCAKTAKTPTCTKAKRLSLRPPSSST